MKESTAREENYVLQKLKAKSPGNQPLETKLGVVPDGVTGG